MFVPSGTEHVCTVYTLSDVQTGGEAFLLQCGFGSTHEAPRTAARRKKQPRPGTQPGTRRQKARRQLLARWH